MTNYLHWCESELRKAGWYDDTNLYADEIAKATLEILTTFDKQNHSGSSANIVTNLVYRLMRWESL